MLPALLLGAGALLACNDQTATTGPRFAASAVVTPGTLDRSEVEVCKFGSSATFNVTTPNGSSTLNLADGGCAVVLTSSGSKLTTTVTEQSQSGVQLDSILQIQGRSPSRVIPLTPDTTRLTGTSTASGFAGGESGALLLFYNSVLPPPPAGCTFTLGYWKNHTNVWPSPNSPSATFFTSGQTWLQVFQTPPKGNAYYILAHQYMAAVLNGGNGAGAPANVASAISTATGYFNNPGGSSLTRQDLIDLATLLDSYNNGNQGVPHC